MLQHLIELLEEQGIVIKLDHIGGFGLIPETEYHHASFSIRAESYVKSKDLEGDMRLEICLKIPDGEFTGSIGNVAENIIERIEKFGNVETTGVIPPRKVPRTFFQKEDEKSKKK